MEEKKYLKISLGTGILIAIVVILVIALVGMYFYYNPKNDKENVENDSKRDTSLDDKIDKIAKELFEKGSEAIRELQSTDFPNYDIVFPMEDKEMNGKRYIKTTELYSNVEKEYSNIFTAEGLKDVLSERFTNVDGVLYASTGGSTGWDIINIELSQISKSNNEIEYNVNYNDIYINDSVSEKKSCKMTIKLVNGNYKISEIDYCNIDQNS